MNRSAGRQQPAQRQHQGGLTLVEVMIALTLSLVLLAGVMQVFVATRTTYRVDEGLARLQENGRFAIGHLAQRVRMAGYLGCQSSSLTNKLNGGTDFAYDLGTPIAGFEASGTGSGDTLTLGAIDPAASSTASDWSPNLDAALVGSVVPGSDVIVVRSADTSVFQLVAPYNDGSAVAVDAAAGFGTGDLLVVSDCSKAHLFQVTAASVSGGTATLSHAAAGTPGNAAAAWTLPAEQYAAGAEVSRADTTAFYIGVGADGSPALFQQVLQSSSAGAGSSNLVAQELIPGAESLQLEYGEDTDGNQLADVYRTADAVADWGSVVAVRMALLVRTQEEQQQDLNAATFGLLTTTVDPVDDRRMRRTFESSVALRNRLP